MSRTALKLSALFFAAHASMSPLLSDPIPMPEARPSSELYWSIQKLNTLGRALYIAAHPDDENTSLISYLSLGGKYNTAYLSLTRGDGGQNLIGPELGDELGVIRTQELMAARRIDGGQQFFTRAKDFGFSKNAEETLRIWDEEEVLSDVVWVIRRFQPDVIITRFNPEPGPTHGHHTASAQLAVEAFEAAADPTRFPEQLEWVEPWQATRVVWNTSTWFFRNSGRTFDESDYTPLEVGGYEPLIGESYNAIASVSRSQHSSQGFGTRVDRGSRIEYFKDLAGQPMDGDLFSGVSTDWSRVEGSSAVQRRIGELLEGFDFSEPQESVGRMLELKEELALLDSDWAERKARELDALILESLGLDLRVLADKPYVVAGEQIAVVVEGVNRSGHSVTVSALDPNVSKNSISLGLSLPENQRIEDSVTIQLPENLPDPQPYWLAEEGTLGMFNVTDQGLIGKPENDAPLYFDAMLEVEGRPIAVRLPLSYREIDPAKGESIRPVVNMPLASVALQTPVALFANGATKTLDVEVSAFTRPISGELSLDFDDGWKIKPASFEVGTLLPGESRQFSFEVTAPRKPQTVTLRAVLQTKEGQEIRSGLKQIRYPHIPEQNIFSDSSVRAVSLDVSKKGERVAYLPGAGDSVAESIREIGYEVQVLSPAQIDLATLSDFDALVFGIRAFNTVEEIDRLMPVVFEFVKKGGTVIAQYNTSHRLLTERLAPYPLSLSRDRVTDETAEMRMLAPEHPAMTTPNTITEADFEGWTQERGLYFPNAWDDAFTPLLSSNDPGEPPRDGSLLVAPYGEGYFVYTGLSWFRQLPKGVPGAYRILANLLSLGQE